MNTPVDLRDTAVLATSRLKRTGEEYSLVFLSATHIDHILALQAVALAELTAAEQHYMVKKDRAFFEEHLAAGHHVFGIVHEGRLIAQSVVVNPTAAHPKTGMTDMQLKVPVDTITILQGVIVDPEYRGNSLMGVMVNAWLAEAQKQGRDHAISETALDNPFSWFIFLQKGMHIESIGFDKSDGVEVYNLHGHIPSLSKMFNEEAKKTVVCPQTDIVRQKKLIAKGYKGAKYDPVTGHIEFHRSRKNAVCTL
jgi:predicted GNAT family N-acyltransferase